MAMPKQNVVHNYEIEERYYIILKSCWNQTVL